MQQVIHLNDRELRSRYLELTLEEFDRLLASAEHAYNVIKDLGPFYGKEDVKEPTFRITAEPVVLPMGAREKFQTFGEDFLQLGLALSKLPRSYKELLGRGLDFRVPPTWRVDAIWDKFGNLRVNEIEGADGATALMMAEQMAYNLQSLDQSTAARIIPTLKKLCSTPLDGKYKLALIRWNNHHATNTRKFIKFLFELSKGDIEIDFYDQNELGTKQIRPNWKKYHGVINESSFSPRELKQLGVAKDQIIISGDYTALSNKGILALVFEKKLKSFWIKQIGEERLLRIQKILIPTNFIESTRGLEEAKKMGQVVKVSWAGSNIAFTTHSKGVAMPEGEIEHSSNERWEFLKTLLKKGARIVSQDYIKPRKIKAYLRKRGTNLEPVEWYNRVCIKYVCVENPNSQDLPNVAITAAEVTLGPNVIPSSRECAFTAGKFQD